MAMVVKKAGPNDQALVLAEKSQNAGGWAKPVQLDALAYEQPFEKQASFESEPMEEKRLRTKKDNLALCKSIAYYIVFLICFTSFVLLDQSTSNAQIVDLLQNKLANGVVPISNVMATKDVFDYLQKVIVPELYKNDAETAMAQAQSKALSSIDMYNRLLGPIRIRQSRVSEYMNCQNLMTPLFSNYNFDCLPAFSSATASQDSFGPQQEFVYTVDATAPSYNGAFATYTGSGFMQLLPSNSSLAALTLITKLNVDGFLDVLTRAVMIEFNIWSENVGAYAAVQIVFEFAANGNAEHVLNMLTMSQRNVTLGGLGQFRDWLPIIFLIIVMILVLHFLFEEFQELIKDWRAYFFDFWNIIDWINLVLLVISFIMRCMNWSDSTAKNLGKAQLDNKDMWVNLQALGTSISLVKFIDGFNAVLIWGKCVKYTKSVPIVKDLIRVLGSALGLFLPFLFMFTIGIIGFALAYNIGFGDKIWNLSTLPKAFVYLIRAFISNVKLMPAYYITPGFGAILILLYYVTFVLVGFNFMFAMMAHAIYESKYDKDRVQKERELEELHQDEPIEELVREVKERSKQAFESYLPKTYARFFGGELQDETDSQESSNGEENEDKQSANGSAYSGSKPSKNKALRDDEAWDQANLDDIGYMRQPRRPTSQELLRAIEHMSGRILSEVSIVGIEIKSELHDVCERVAQMQMAAEELSWRADQVRVGQQAALMA